MTNHSDLAFCSKPCMTNSCSGHLLHREKGCEAVPTSEPGFMSSFTMRSQGSSTGSQAEMTELYDQADVLKPR